MNQTFDALHVIAHCRNYVLRIKRYAIKTTRNDVIKLTTKNANANVETKNENDNAKTIVHTNDTTTYKTMRENANTRRNVRFDHSKCNHRNDKNDRAKCRKLMQSNATTFVYVETSNENDAK
jgi:hypothetical protein